MIFCTWKNYHHGKNENQHFLMEEYFVTPQIKYLSTETIAMSCQVGIRNGKREWKDTFPIEWKKARTTIPRKSKALYLMNKIGIKNWEFTQGYRRKGKL